MKGEKKMPFFRQSSLNAVVFLDRVGTVCYYTFKIMNMKTPDAQRQVSALLRAIDHPARLQILLVIGEDEACVCHLQASLGWRQAYISQHLMAMRKAGVLQSRRKGRFVYYRLTHSRLLALIHHAATIVGVSMQHEETLAGTTIGICKCPKCRQNNDASQFHSVGLFSDASSNP